MEDTKTEDYRAELCILHKQAYMHNAYLLVIFHAIRNLQFLQSIIVSNK